MTQAYEHDLDMLIKITQALLYIQEQMEKNPVTYPEAMIAYNTILFGLIPRINTNCQHDSECQVSTNFPVGGLTDALQTIQEAIESLQLEIELGSLSEREALDEVGGDVSETETED
jgi:hypothetical protein